MEGEGREKREGRRGEMGRREREGRRRGEGEEGRIGENHMARILLKKRVRLGGPKGIVQGRLSRRAKNWLV